ncbi:MAG: hypothetical protein KGJ93_04625 [Patescibacteria group bacterium]|nr:hypothetical protein [Patescibacteria group bacterium]
MPQIVPAILEETKEGFLERIGSVIKLSELSRIQVDFGDGEFIEKKLLPADEIGPLNPTFEWEAHLMVRQPADFLDYKIAGFSVIAVHYEAFESKADIHRAVKAIRDGGLKPALVINPETKVEVLAEFDNVSQFQIMGVHPGRQGQPFLPQTQERIRELRKLLPDAIIEVDGGINETNIKQIAQAGADLIVVGSALVKARDIKSAYEKLVSILNSN